MVENIMPYSNNIKCLDLILDARLQWKERVQKREEDLELEIQKIVLAFGQHNQ